MQTSAGGDTYNQFKAYIESGHEFRYYFNNGLSDAMKTKFQNVFKNQTKMQELWNINSDFFKQFKLPNGQNISSWQQVKQLADNNLLINHEMLNFIK